MPYGAAGARAARYTSRQFEKVQTQHAGLRAIGARSLF